jgi:hypothetical protein
MQETWEEIWCHCLLKNPATSDLSIFSEENQTDESFAIISFFHYETAIE